MASSSSSSSIRIRNYDVFLSFRGEDTRRTFVSFLYEALCREGIFTFRDDRRLEAGDNISDQLIEAIKTSCFAVVVISKNYATSKWCLEELRLIMELHSENRIKVVPMFYEVEPTDVRHQTGSFANAFHEYEQLGVEPERISNWRRALNQVGNLSGYHSRTSDEAAMISDAVGFISSQLLDMRQPSGVDLVGMEAHMMKMHSSMNKQSENEVLRIGIWGMGGVGKTTIAKCLYDRLSRHFPARYFIDDIKKVYKDKSPSYLQEKFLSNLLCGQHIGFLTDEAGSKEIKARLGHQKVFIVLDGVDKAEQIQALAKETSWFGPGSRIIITTRDKGLLYSCGVFNVHEVECLGNKDALQVFKKLAFGGIPPPSCGFEQLFMRASRLCHGLPSALVAYASYLSENTTTERWEEELHLLQKRPHKNVEKILRHSYDDLDEQDKAACLHVACLFNGYPFNHVTSLLDDGRPRIIHLTTKSLISISAAGCINMHFLVAQTGREIVRQESRNRPPKQRFLWDCKEIYEVLNNHIGTDETEGVTLSMCEMADHLRLSSTVFNLMHSIKFLKFFQHSRDVKSKVLLRKDGVSFPPNLRLLHWDSCPLKILSPFRHVNLVQVELRYSNLERIWDKTVKLQNLERLDVTGSKNLMALPDFSTAKKLEELIVEGCMRLQKMPPESLRCLARLTKLNAIGCNILGGVTFTIRLQGITRSHWPTVLKFPGSEGVLFNFLTDLSIEGQMDIEVSGLGGGYAEHLSFRLKQHIPEEVIAVEQETVKLERMDQEIAKASRSLKITRFNYKDNGKPFFFCYSFQMVYQLTELKLINLNIQDIHGDIICLLYLTTLDLSGNDFRQLPKTMGKLTKLKYLSLGNCRKLRELPQLDQVETLILSDCVKIRSLLDIEESQETYCLLELKLDNCNKVRKLSGQLHRLTKLTYLDLSRNEFENVPESIRELTSLGTLFLDNCKKLKALENLPQSIKYLYAHGCDSLDKVSLPQDHSIKHLDLNHCPRLNREEHKHLMDLFQEVPRRCVCLREPVESSANSFRSLKSLFKKGFS